MPQVDIIISNSSGKPIYEQITDQVKEQIMAGALAAALTFHSSGDKLYAEVWQNDTLIERVQLTDATDRTIKLDGNTIVLSGKTAKMADADCRDQVCVRTGTLTHAGQAAVCLPHRVVLKLVGMNDSGIDAVVS